MYIYHVISLGIRTSIIIYRLYLHFGAHKHASKPTCPNFADPTTRSAGCHRLRTDAGLSAGDGRGQGLAGDPLQRPRGSPEGMRGFGKVLATFWQRELEMEIWVSGIVWWELLQLFFLFEARFVLCICPAFGTRLIGVVDGMPPEVPP